MPRMQALLFRHLAFEARPRGGLSRVNRILIGLILLSVATTIVATEPSLDSATSLMLDRLRQALSAVFAVEYVARVYAAGQVPQYAGWRGRIRFMLRPGMIVDLIAVGPELVGISENSLLMRIVRVARVLRIARMGRLSAASIALAAGLRARAFELALSIAIACGLLIASATVMYWIEGEGQPENFGSIPRALWWSVATLTTVGYGDVVPLTAIGKVVAGLTAVLAIGLVAMPAGIFAAAFSDAFQRNIAARAESEAAAVAKSGDASVPGASANEEQGDAPAPPSPVAARPGGPE